MNSRFTSALVAVSGVSYLTLACQCQFVTMNDPWTPQSTTTVQLQPAPANPLHQLISSDRYLESLEKKLGRLKSKNEREPTSHDIVKSLSKFRDDQMEHFLKREAIQSIDSSANGGEVTSASYLQRRLYPEKQPVTGEELVVLIQDDALAKRVAEEQEQEEMLGNDTMTTDTVTSQQETVHNEGDSVAKAAASVETVSLESKEAGASGASSPTSDENKR